VKRARGILFKTALAIAACALLLATIRLLPHPPLSSYAPSSTAVFDAQGRLLRLTLADDQQYRLWTPLAQVSPEMVQALLLHEDQHFYRHPGVNPAALLRAAAATYSGGVRQGGSTLTMQLARLVWHLNTRTPWGKLKQIARALQLELCYSKNEILEAHLNLLPYGQNIQGVGAASLIYFGKTADHLSLPESLTLALIPQSPMNRDPAQGEPASLREARQRLFARWVELHARASEQAGLIAMPLQYRGPRTLPFAAPHLTAMLLQERAHGAIHSTLDGSLQRVLEQQIGAYVSRNQRVGIRNASALLVDTRSMEVKALVGSADFYDSTIQGQVNGTQARRSPGSALKPFIYALAMDQGLIHPQSVMKDAPTAFGPFSPENFDGQFVGPITAHDALIRSRNIPAVALSAKLSQPGFYQFLKTAGVAHMSSEQHYGLALALGGGEVTMEELATLYAMLANRGVLKPLRYVAGDETQEGLRLLSEEASFMVLDILRDNPRPDAPFAQRSERLPVAWKTGTSWGFRDAWTAGSFGPYVLVVWVGNFDGSSNPAFVGIKAAAPLFFQIVDAVKLAQPKLADPVFRGAPNLARVEVCAASGDLPNADCPQTVSTWFIPGKSPIRVSQIHRRLLVDTRTGRQACAPFDVRTTRSEVYEFWPSDLQRLFAQAGMPRRKPPPPGDCAMGDSVAGITPTITSPLSGAAYELRAARVGEETVAFNANVDADVRAVYWFVDDAFVGAGKPGVALGWVPLHSGSYNVRAVDDHGRADSRELRIGLVR
jgi:penicillin-binding protein 1C